MAAEEITLRDGNQSDSQPFPPDGHYIESNHTPAKIGRSILLETVEHLYPTSVEIETFDHTDLTQNEAYTHYMMMHKVLVGNCGARLLEQLYGELKDERMPHYLVAAGWAAVESALVRSDISVPERKALLDHGVASWDRALEMQRYLVAHAPEALIEYGYGHRIAMDKATAPLLAGVIAGDVTEEACRQAYLECLNVAQSNSVYIDLMLREQNADGLAAHIGIGYECNALLAFNRKFSPTWFAIPSMARSDSGYFYRNQTHDLLVVHQKYGNILSATPVEIKAKSSARDRERYDALLVRGKMHLSVEGKYTPEHTLNALAAVYEGQATEEELRIADNATNRFTDMVRDYYAGEQLGKLASRHSVTIFHDKTQVIARHPGLGPTTAVA